MIPLAQVVTTKAASAAPAAPTVAIHHPGTLVAAGGNGQASTSIAVPPGVAPKRVSGKVTAASQSSGQVLLYVAGRLAKALPARTGGTFAVPVSSADVTEDRLSVSIRNQFAPGTDTCVSDTTSTETLTDLTLTATGTELAPTAVANFLGPAVTGVSVIVPDGPPTDISQAALAAVGAAALRYPRPVEVGITFEGGLVKPAPGLRVITIQPGPNPVKVAVSAPKGIATLTITGQGPELVSAATALGSPLIGVAGAPEVSDLSQQGRSQSSLTQTLADLGDSNPSLAGLGVLSTNVAVDQSKFGGPISDVQIHLVGANTPVQENAAATASLLWNNQLVASQRIGDSDHFTMDVSIGSTLLKRNNSMSLQLTATPPGGRCDIAVQPTRLDLDGRASTVTATRGQSLIAGFDRFPQSLGSILSVAFGSGGTANQNTVNAGLLVSSLQRLTSEQLQIRLSSTEDLLSGSAPGLLVGATPENADALAAPLRFAPFRTVDATATKLAVDVNSAYAAFEGFEHNGRNMLMLGSYSPTETDPVVASQLTSQLALAIDANPTGWFTLAGNIRIAQPGIAQLNIDSGSLVPQAQVAAERSLIPWWVWVVVIVVVAAGGARLWYARRRRAAIRAAVDRQMTEL